jgi:hypothetical protein
VRELTDLAGTARADLDHRGLRVHADPEQRQRDADRVVEALRRPDHREPRGEDVDEDVLRARLPARAGDADDARAPRLAVAAPQRQQGLARVRHPDDEAVALRRTRVLGDHDARRAARDGVGEEAVPVELRPAQGHEQVPSAHLA